MLRRDFTALMLSLLCIAVLIGLLVYFLVGTINEGVSWAGDQYWMLVLAMLCLVLLTLYVRWSTLLQTGLKHMRRAHFRKAKQDLEAALKALTPWRSHPVRRVPVLNALAELATFMADYPRSLRYSQEAVALAEQAEDPYRPMLLAASLSQLGNTQVEAGLLEEAEKTHRQVQEMLAVLLPPLHPYQGIWMTNLARVYLTRGDYAEAERLYLQAFETFARRVRKNSLLRGVAMHNMGTLRRLQERYDEAWDFLEQSRPILRKTFVEEHPLLATGKASRADILRAEGRLQEAQDLCLEVLDSLEEVLDRDHPLIAETLALLALVLEERGQEDDAERCYRQALDIRNRVGVTRHPSTVRIMTRYADLLLRRGRTTLAEEIQTQADSLLSQEPACIPTVSLADPEPQSEGIRLPPE